VKPFAISLITSALALFALSADNWENRVNAALAFAGAEAVIERADGTALSAPLLIDGNRDDDSAMSIGCAPVDLVITLPRLTRVDAVRIFAGIVGYAGNPSGECGIRSYALDGFVNGGWLPLTGPVTNAPTVMECAADGRSFCYTHSFPPRTIEKVRVRVLAPSDTGRRVSSPDKPAVPVAQRACNLREIEVFAAGDAVVPLHHISKLVEGDFRLPVWLNRDEASLWLYPAAAFSQTLELLISFKERETGHVPRAPLRLRLSARDRPLKAAIPIRGWPDGEYRTVIRVIRQDGADSGELVRLLRRQTLPEPPKPAAPVSVRNMTLPMVDDWYFTGISGAARHRIHPAELLPVTTGPLKPGRVLQGGSRVSVADDGTVKITFWDKERDGSDMRRHLAVSRDLVRWNITELPTAAHTPDVSRPGCPVTLLASLTRPLRPALFPATASLRPLPRFLPAAAPQAAPVETYRFYDAKRDGPVDLAQISVRWVGLKDTALGDIPAVARSAWPVWNKSQSEKIVLLKEPLTVDKPEYQAGELDTWRDTNDNFGGQWLNRERTRLHYCRTRTTVRFPPFRIPYDNMWQVNRILAVWSTTNGLDWQTTWFSQPTEDESIGLQHYGVNTFALENERLRMGYVYHYDQVTQQIWIELNTSRDGLHWKRAPGRVPLATNGPPGSATFGMLFSDDREVPHGDHMLRTLNNCFSGVHFYEFTRPPETLTADTLQRRYATRGLAEQWPFFQQVGGWEGLAAAMRGAYKSIVLMRMRRDGWSSLRADSAAVATTCPLTAGTSLALNARTDDGGSIRVELLDEAGRPLPNYCGGNAATFRGDATRYPLSWQGGAVTALPAGVFRLRLTLEKADCFALTF